MQQVLPDEVYKTEFGYLDLVRRYELQQQIERSFEDARFDFVAHGVHLGPHGRAGINVSRAFWGRPSCIVCGLKHFPHVRFDLIDRHFLPGGKSNTERPGTDPLEVRCAQLIVLAIASPVLRQRDPGQVADCCQRPTDRTCRAVALADVVKQGCSNRLSVIAERSRDPGGNRIGMTLINRMLLPEQFCLIHCE